MSPLLNSIIANAAISLLSLLGAITLLTKRLQSENVTSILVSFAAGVMLGASFFSILPEALEQITVSNALAWVLVGIVVSFFIERFFLWHHHHHDDTRSISPSAYLILFGDAVHNFIDGVAIMAAFLISPPVGITTTIAIAAHEIPQELADFSILIHAGMKKKKAIIYNLLSALTAILGALTSFWFLMSFEWIIPLALSFTAGMFIYIALADLVPELHSESGVRSSISQSLPFVVGILIMYLITFSIPHAHDQEEKHDENYFVEESYETDSGNKDRLY